MTIGLLPPRVVTRLPTNSGIFKIALFRDSHDVDHLALYLGELSTEEPVLTRVHSECLTGDVFGSRRCDCGEQLDEAFSRIAQIGRGLVLYLRQEGRGIGLLEKLKAYNLQDDGYDTVDANLALGHEADGRDYSVAAEMLASLGISQVRLMTNNPAKVDALRELGLEVSERVPLVIAANPDNRNYLKTKLERMHHMLDLPEGAPTPVAPTMSTLDDLFAFLSKSRRESAEAAERPVVTLSYAQSIDGCSAAVSDRPLALSGDQSLRLTHRLRGAHDGILVGIRTIFADNPRLTVRLMEGQNPQPIILDSRLRFPIDAELLSHPDKKVWIATTALADPERASRLEAKGAKLIRVATNAQGQVDLEDLLQRLRALNIRSLMVEGGGRVITQFIHRQLIDQLVITVAPVVVGGIRAVGQLPSIGPHLQLQTPRYTWLGPDMIVWGSPLWLK